MLVSRPFLAFGTVSGSEALVSRSLAFPAASMFSGSLAGGALAQLLFISLYCRVHIMLQACLSPSYPWTLVLRPRRTQLAWNAPGLASPSSLVGTGDQPGTQATFPRFCSSTPLLLPQECCERRSFLPACAPAGLPRGNRALALSVRQLQCGASSHCFAPLRLWVGLADRSLGPTRAQLKDGSRSALLPMPTPSSAHLPALGPAPLDFATCGLTKEPSPAELELK